MVVRGGGIELWIGSSIEKVIFLFSIWYLWWFWCIQFFFEFFTPIYVYNLIHTKVQDPFFYTIWCLNIAFWLLKMIDRAYTTISIRSRDNLQKYTLISVMILNIWIYEGLKSGENLHKRNWKFRIWWELNTRPLNYKNIAHCHQNKFDTIKSSFFF